MSGSEQPQAVPGAAPRAGTHHSHLGDALIEAVLALIEERGVEHATIRDAAKRAGVSPGAPFRHFRNKAALMTAVAELAMSRFRDVIAAALAEVADRDPLTRFRAIGIAYLRWVARSPTHFEIIGNRRMIDFGGSASLLRQSGEIRTMMAGLLEEARRLGQLRTDIETDHILLMARALGYGLFRMTTDGHFSDWPTLEEEPEAAKLRVLDLFMKQIGWEESRKNA